MKYDRGNYPSFQQLPKQHNAHVLAYTLHKLDFEQMEMRVASYGAYKRPRTEGMLPDYEFSFQPYPKHDAHVKAYNDDFLNTILRIYKQNYRLRNQLHNDPTFDLGSRSDYTSFWEEHGKRNFFPAQPTQTSGVAKQVSSSFSELTDSIDNKLTELGIDREEFITADYKTSNSYLPFKMLKPSPKSPVFVPVFIDLSNYQRQGGKTDLIDAMREAFLGTHITGSGTDMAGYSKASDAELTGGLLRGTMEVFGGAGKSHMYYTDDSSWIQKPVAKDTNTDQTYKKRKHIPNNQEEQKARKAKLLAKNKFFK